MIINLCLLDFVLFIFFIFIYFLKLTNAVQLITIHKFLSLVFLKILLFKY